MEEDDNSIELSWNVWLIVLGAVVNGIGCYVATSLVEQYRLVMELKPRVLGKYTLLGLVCVAYGGTAVWSSTFIYISAFSLKTKGGLDIPLKYNVAMSFFSLIAVLICMFIGIILLTSDKFYSVTKSEYRGLIAKDAENMTITEVQDRKNLWKIALFRGLKPLVLGGIISGIGLGLMFYLGLFAVEAPVKLQLTWWIVVLSALLGMVACTSGVWILFRVLSFFPHIELLRFVVSIQSGAASVGTFFLGMSSIELTYRPEQDGLTGGMAMTPQQARMTAFGFAMLCLWIIGICLFIEMRSWIHQSIQIIHETEQCVQEMMTTSPNERIVKIYRNLRSEHSSTHSGGSGGETNRASNYASTHHATSHHVKTVQVVAVTPEA